MKYYLRNQSRDSEKSECPRSANLPRFRFLNQIKSANQNSRMRNHKLIVVMSIYLWTIVSLGINNTKSRVNVNLNYENFFRCLYTFLHFHLLMKNEIHVYKRKMQNHLISFSQIWHKVFLNELNSSLCKIMKSHALLQRLSLIKTCKERIWSFVHPFRMPSDWTIADSEYLDESLPCHWSCCRLLQTV